jgi:hypothetical protein
MTTSMDGGLNFSEIKQVKGPEDTGGYGTPFNIELGVSGSDVLMIWEVGEPGATQCTFYSQSSPDSGQSWSNPSIMLDARSLCPEQLKFLFQQEDFSMVILKYKGGNPSLMVWNGVEWGSPQVQNELSSFTNPLTFDTILLGCKNEFLAETTLYLAGCDEGAGGDIWMTSRSLEPLDQWAGSSSVWSFPNVLRLKPGLIANVTQLPENELIHTVWTESSLTGAGNHSIYYAQLKDGNWSTPKEMITGLIGKPAELSMALGNQQNLYVVWADEQGGSLVYTTVNSERAGLRTEWADPRGIPTATRFNASPDILIDASGRVAIVYAVPYNEERGIYLIQADGRELAWSAPMQVFDAVTASWDRVDNPVISLTSDGKLHVLFSRLARDGGHAIGLYYSQSSDGGAMWSVPELIREGFITWSDMVTTDGVTLHRLWQEDRNGVISNFHQVSRDGGTTWGSAIEITGALDYVSPVTLAVNNTGDLHVLRIAEGTTPGFLKEYELFVEDWQWDGSLWSNQAFQKISIKGDRANYFVSGGLATNGQMSALVSAEYFDLNGQPESQIVGTNRQVEVNNSAAEPFSAQISIPQVLVPPPTEVAGGPANDEPLASESSSLSQYRNLAGIILVVIVIVLGLYFMRRRGRSKS